MASDLRVARFFARLANDEGNQGRIVVNEMPRLDIDMYINNYVGRTRFDRLMHIARTSTHLCVDALKAAVAEAKQGDDVNNYKAAWHYISIAAPLDPAADLDETWIGDKAAANAAKLKELEAQLSMYQNNLIKESIRMANKDLGKFHESKGNLPAALEAYIRMRQDILMTVHAKDIAWCLMRVHIHRKEYSHALGALNKSHLMDEERPTVTLEAIKGLCLLALGRYSEAAKSFLVAQPPRPPVDYSDTLSANDVAVYGGLLALATMDRAELQKDVLNSQNFRVFMAHEPYMRKAITLFVNCRYAACLEMLESYRADYMLDMHLQPHVNFLLSKIRIKCIKQFCGPFLSISFATLREQFGVRGNDVLDELVTMMDNGELPNGRLDFETEYLENYPPNPRAVALSNAETVQRKIHTDLTDRLSHMSGFLAEDDAKEAAASQPEPAEGPFSTRAPAQASGPALLA